jgi:hypothetical protein
MGDQPPFSGFSSWTRRGQETRESHLG